MTEIDRQIIELFHQLPSDEKQVFLNFARALSLEVKIDNTSAHLSASAEERLGK